MIDFIFKKKSPIKSPKEIKNPFLTLDIGTEAIKVILCKKENQEINILGDYVEYFDRYGFFDSWEFEKDVLKKTINQAIKGLLIKIHQKVNFLENKPALITLPPNIFKARIGFYSLTRNNPNSVIEKNEEKEIYQKILNEAKKDVSLKYHQEFGILPQDIEFINFKIIEIKIDGYKVLSLKKYQGKKLDFIVLITFLPKDYLTIIRDILSIINLTIKKIVHLAESLNSYQEKKNGIFLDVGGLITQIFIINNDVLVAINEIPIGGQLFSKEISQKLGLSEKESRILKERYSKKELSIESTKRINDFFYKPAQIWFENLKAKLKESIKDSLISNKIIIFGGTSQLPQISLILKKGGWNGYIFGEKVEVETFFPKNKYFENLQLTPALLTSFT